jgi:cytochrome c553
MRSTMVAGVAAVCLGLAVLVQAAGDPGAGEKKAAACADCHGVDGNSVTPTNPKLAGQHALYLVNAMKAYADGRRNHAAMTAFVQPLNMQDLEDIAAFYATQQPK